MKMPPGSTHMITGTRWLCNPCMSEDPEAAYGWGKYDASDFGTPKNKRFFEQSVWPDYDNGYSEYLDAAREARQTRQAEERAGRLAHDIEDARLSSEAQQALNNDPYGLKTPTITPDFSKPQDWDG